MAKPPAMIAAYAIHERAARATSSLRLFVLRHQPSSTQSCLCIIWNKRRDFRFLRKFKWHSPRPPGHARRTSVRGSVVAGFALAMLDVTEKNCSLGELEHPSHDIDRFAAAGTSRIIGNRAIGLREHVEAGVVPVIEGDHSFFANEDNVPKPMQVKIIYAGGRATRPLRRRGQWGCGHQRRSNLREAI